MNTNVEEILERFALHPPSTAIGRYYTTCPKCSAARSRTHQKRECLGITINDQGVAWGCNHCDFKGGTFYKLNGDARDQSVATYDYYDENGNLLFQVCRTSDKKFPQRRPDGNGGWIWNIKGVRKVPFRLNEVTEAIANDHPILIVEGEKDVLNLERIGIAATCNPGGASEPGKKPKWTKEYSEMLRGANIIVVPDHDAPGYAHAAAIASTSAGLAKSVRILKLVDHWPDCPPGGDISDWLAAGHSREQLDELIARGGTVEQLHDLIECKAKPGTPAESVGTTGVLLDDFLAYMPAHGYIFAPARDLWPAASVNSRLPPIIGPDGKPVSPAKWLDANAAVEQMTWAPGKPMLIKDRLISDGGWIVRPGCTVFNLYRPPSIAPRAGDVAPWLNLVGKVFPDQAAHIVLWLAQPNITPTTQITNGARARVGRIGIHVLHVLHVLHGRGARPP